MQSDSGQFDEAISAIVNLAKHNPSPEPVVDMFTSFAKTIAIQLKELPQINAHQAMSEIQSVIAKHSIEVLKAQISIPPAKENYKKYKSSTPNDSNNSYISYTASNSQSNCCSDVLQLAITDADINDDFSEFNVN